MITKEMLSELKDGESIVVVNPTKQSNGYFIGIANRYDHLWFVLPHAEIVKLHELLSKYVNI